MDEGLDGPTLIQKVISYIITPPATGGMGEQTRAVYGFYVHSLRFNNLRRPDCFKILSLRSRDQYNPSVT